MFTLKELQDKVEKRISDYIEFDVNEIFFQGDYITIYGGAIRDSIAELEIHDIDVLCMPESAGKLFNFLEKKGYEPLDLYDVDALALYESISLIAEPWTLMNKNRKIIQIIRPRWRGQIGNNKTNMQTSHQSDYEIAHYSLIKNVDLSCCGLLLEVKNDKLVLKEACKNAIVDCLTKSYTTNNWSSLYERNRTMIRQHKLSKSGWQVNDSTDDFFYPMNEKEEKRKLKLKRTRKIYSLEFQPELDYKIWTEEEYKEHLFKVKDLVGLPF